MKATFPTFCLSDSPRAVCEEIKLLMSYPVTGQMSKISRQRCKIYSQVNMLIWEFSMCSDAVKCSVVQLLEKECAEAQGSIR